MVIKKLKIADLKVCERFLLSYPLRPELYPEFKKLFPGLPPLVVNKNQEILFGIDFYHFLLTSKNTGEVDVLQGDFTDKEAMFLNYNLRNKFFGLNLYEKLIFVKKVASQTEKHEIYERTALDINMNGELLEKLEQVTGCEFEKILTTGGITLKSALTLCDFQENDRLCLIELFHRLSFTASQQLKILEMTEEILFRDKSSTAELFGKLEISTYYNVEKPQKKIIDEIFKYRFPIYREKEREWEQEIKDLELPGSIKITHYPFFEKKQVDLHLCLQEPQQLKKIIPKIKKITSLSK